jgi:hypothetical protein
MKLKLNKGRSYAGYGVVATAASPIVTVEDAKVAARLVASGYFIQLDVVDATQPVVELPPGGEDVNVDKMNSGQLDKYAAENGIDLTGASNVAQKREAVKAALAGGLDFGEGE